MSVSKTDRLDMHGERRFYQDGCHCQYCTAANSKYMKERREGLTQGVKAKRYESLARVWESYLITGSEFTLSNKVREIMNGEEDAK